MPSWKSPGVYVEETSVLRPLGADGETAVPAFIGYTQQAQLTKPDDLALKPTKVSSLAEYERYYGGRHNDAIGITLAGDAAGGFSVTALTVNSRTPGPTCRLPYLLYYAVRMFFENGGRQCYIVSVGTYRKEPSITLRGTDAKLRGARHIDSGLLDGLDVVAREDEPTLIVVPDAVNLDTDDYRTLVQAVLAQAGALQDRFAILDVYDGNVELDTPALSRNRSYFGDDNLKFGAAYYPFLRTRIAYYQEGREANVTVTLPDGTTPRLDTLKTANAAAYEFVKDVLGGRASGPPDVQYFVIVPPSGAVAGAYAATDAARGVWKAPANVSLADVIEPVIRIDDRYQERLNVDSVTGKSINTIRTFAGKGTLVWGARTLAGNDNEWRYVSVRRFFSMVEESVEKGISWAVFEPNDAGTWAKVRGVIETYLTQLWRAGALAGATTNDAYFVRCGLGATMTAQDILEGRTIVEIGMAVMRPAEFIILSFMQQLPPP